MKKSIAPILFGLTLVMSACVPSLNPLYTEKDVVFDPALVGIWEQGKEVWAFEKAGGKKYKLLYTDDKAQTARFEVHLVKLQKYLFLDMFLITPDAGESNEKGDKMKMNALAAFSLVPGHLFLKVSQLSPKLQISLQDAEWLKKYLAENPKAVRHRKFYQNPEQADDYMICLTAETKDLQKFMLKLADTKDAFGDPSDLERRKTQADGGKVESNP